MRMLMIAMALATTVFATVAQAENPNSDTRALEIKQSKQRLAPPPKGYSFPACKKVSSKVCIRTPGGNTACENFDEGARFAKSLLMTLQTGSSEERSRAYVDYNDNIRLLAHGGEQGFKAFEYVFCGDKMEKVAANVFADAFTGRNDVLMAGARHFMREVGTAAMRRPKIEERLRESTDELERIALVHYWFEAKLESFDTFEPADQKNATAETITMVRQMNNNQRQRHASEMITELEKNFPTLRSSKNVAAAIDFYKKRFAKDVCFCQFMNDGPVELFYLNPDFEPIPDTLTIATPERIEKINTTRGVQRGSKPEATK